MTRSTHPFEPQEVMAYLDGELQPECAAAVALHLNNCAECQALATELRGVSQRIIAWQIEPSPAGLEERVSAALENVQAKSGETRDFTSPITRQRFFTSRWTWALTGVVGACALVFLVLSPQLFYYKSAPAGERARSLEAFMVPAPQSASAPASHQPAAPMIIRTAALTLVTRDFDGSRAGMERVVSQRQGYIAQLNVTGGTSVARALTASLRLPVERFDDSLGELKQLGRLVQESRSGEEISQKYVDLVARLGNARNTERRLIDVLQQRTGKVADILSVEQEIARVRGEIESMEAQRKNLENQVRFATVQLSLTEEYKAQLEISPPSTGRRLQNALIEGYRATVESAIELAYLALRYGPALLFWVAILFWPSRFILRRVEARHRTRAEE